MVQPKDVTGADLVAAKAVDLIALPENVDGTRCGNCMFFKDGMCVHPSVNMLVEPNWCCDEWDAPGAYVFQKDGVTTSVTEVHDAGVVGGHRVEIRTKKTGA